jgi:hypothetical protein
VRRRLGQAGDRLGFSLRVVSKRSPARGRVNNARGRSASAPRAIPIVFNFDKPETKDFTETIRLLAGLSRFVIADVTNPKSAPLELQATVPEIMVPFLPIIEEGQEPFAMLRDYGSSTATGSSSPFTIPP